MGAVPHLALVDERPCAQPTHIHARTPSIAINSATSSPQNQNPSANPLHLATREGLKGGPLLAQSLKCYM
jgi:hypothetical protein